MFYQHTTSLHSYLQFDLHNIERKKSLDVAIEYIDTARLSQESARREFFAGRSADEILALEDENDDFSRQSITFWGASPDNYWRSVKAEGKKFLEPLERINYI